MARGKFIAYYRVSTARQGRSGLGLEAQRESVMAFLNGGQWQLVAEYTEVESGRKTDQERPQLAEALSACRLYGATLVIARLDRLSRNAAFLLALRDSGADFVAADMPEANRLTVGIMAVMAEHTRETISTNTREALAAAKRRGVKLGSPQNLTAEGRRKGYEVSAEARGDTADQRAKDLAPIIAEEQRAGVTSLRELAAALDRRGIPASRGGPWSAVQVARVLRRIQAAG